MVHGYFRNHGCRHLEFELLGYRTVTLENDVVRVTVIADLGARLYELLHKPSDTDVLWRWHRGLRPKDHVASTPNPRGSFQDHFAGGWNELFPSYRFPSFGGPVEMGGLPIGYHGEVACVPWEYVLERDDPEEVAIRFEVRTVRTPFRLTRTMRLRHGRPTLFISETATNEGGIDVPFVWGHHPDLGAPFLDRDCVVDTGATRVAAYRQDAYRMGRVAAEDQEGHWPHLKGRDGAMVDLSRVLGPDARVSDCFYLTEFADPAWAAVTNRRTGIGVGLAWSRSIMPHALVWQGFGGDEIAPWWGSAYTLCVEPLSSYPMDYETAVRQGTALRLGPGESLPFEMVASVYAGTGRVQGMTADGTVIRADRVR
jgi:galactose mutarotase-like enzyme